MLADLVYEDVVIMSASPVLNCKEFREQAMAEAPEDMEDKKLFVVAKIMQKLKEGHDTFRPQYLELYKKATGKESDYYI